MPVDKISPDGYSKPMLPYNFSFVSKNEGESNSDYVIRLKELSLPLPAIAVLFAVLPLIKVRRWSKEESFARQGHCHACGYDLRATPDRCPECGTIPKKVST